MGLLGGRRERTTVPWPGFAMEDSKGERMGIAGFRMMEGVFRSGAYVEPIGGKAGDL